MADTTTQTTDNQQVMSPDIMLSKVCAFFEILENDAFFNTFEYVKEWWDGFKQTSDDERIRMYNVAVEKMKRVEGLRSIYFNPKTPDDIKQAVEQEILTLEAEMDQMVEEGLKKFPEFDDVINLFNRYTKSSKKSVTQQITSALNQVKTENEEFRPSDFPG